MSQVRAVGMVIYTYAEIEPSMEALWDWSRQVEKWTGQPYAEFLFSPRGKESHRVLKASQQNLANLYQRLQTDRPWYLLDLAWPKGSLRSLPAITGFVTTAKSEEQLGHSGEAYRTPSYVSLLVNPQYLASGKNGVAGFLQLGVRLWDIVHGVYGFIDVETGIPLQDNLVRNIDHLYSNLVPPQHDPEFRMWHMLMPCLHRRVWKAFWGNFLGDEHLLEIGGVRDMQRADPGYRRLPAYEDEARQRAVSGLLACSAEYLPLTSGGVLLTLSDSPLSCFDPDLSGRVDCLQRTFGRVALGRWDEASTSPCETR